MSKKKVKSKSTRDMKRRVLRRGSFTKAEWERFCQKAAFEAREAAALDKDEVVIHG